MPENRSGKAVRLNNQILNTEHLEIAVNVTDRIGAMTVTDQWAPAVYLILGALLKYGRTGTLARSVCRPVCQSAKQILRTDTLC